MLSIGQLAKRSGVRTSTLRYYESEGLLNPSARSDAGYRLYDKPAEQNLRFIQRAQRLGFSLSDIRLLLHRINDQQLRQEEVLAVAEARYVDIEKQITQLLVLRHEMGLFLQDTYQRDSNGQDKDATDEQSVANALYSQLVDRICAAPETQAITTMLEWLLQTTGCPLTMDDAQHLLDRLRGEHIHIWQSGDDYHILVVNNDPQIATTLEELAQLEARCQVHQHTNRMPQVMHDDEGYLLICRGDNAFVFARLFLSIAS